MLASGQESCGTGRELRRMGVKLRIQLTENLSYVPPVLGYLASVAQFTDGYRRYRVRHPGGIFNLQLGAFASSLLDLVTEVSSQERTMPLGDNKDLLRKLSATLFAFTNYYNAAYDIILGCCKPENGAPSVEVWKWLKEHGYTAESVYRSSLSEATFFLDLFNELKHSSKRFGIVSLTRRSDKVRVFGYYLECVDELGVIIPDPDYHGNGRGEHAANSFNYDLRRLYYLLYKIADVLVAALQHHFEKVYAVTLPFDSTRREDATLLGNLFEAVSNLPVAFLPNELRKPVPIPRIAGRRDYKYLVFENYKSEGARDLHETYDVNTLLPAPDGFSKQWGLPYFRQGADRG